MKLVPREPTAEMKHAAFEAIQRRERGIVCRDITLW